jgi:hypothetical protein
MDQSSLFKKYEDVFKGSEESTLKTKKENAFGYSPFALQDAIGEKNIKKAWLEYEKLRLAGIEAEELIYKMVSKTRDMVAIGKGASKEDLGLKDYPFAKSKRDFKNWQTENLKNFYTKLIEIYHYSRIKGDDLDIAIEKTLLSI